MSTSNSTDPANPDFLVFYKGLTEGQLLAYFQSQIPGNAQGCGPFAIAIAANLSSGSDKGSNYKGAEVQAILEGRGFKIHGIGMPTWLGYGRSLGYFVQGRVEYKSNASIKDLEHAISDDKLPVVAVAWQTTCAIFRDIRHARVGHYLVAVGFEAQKKQLYFLNPGLGPGEGLAGLNSWTYQEFKKSWNETWNIFIRPGSMWTISSIVQPA